VKLLLDLITQYGLLVVFLSVAVEQAGAPIPAYPMLLVAGSLAAEGRLSLPAAFALAVLACVLADGLWYVAGQRFGSRVLRLICRLSLSPDGCVRQTESIFARWGAPSLLVAKFVPGFGSVATSMAGSTGIGRGAFVFYDALGSALWAGSGLALGWLFAPAVNEALEILQQMGQWGLLLVLLLLAVFVASRALRRYRFRRRLRMDRITVDDLAAMLQRGEAPVVVDVRQTVARDDGRIPGAIVFNNDAWPDSLRATDAQTLVVVYCACPNEASAALVARKLMQRGFKRVRPLLGGIDAWRAAGLQVEPA
jgi:membrane protein DedA with SNARE-associated domain/rhodanese-related sulfurtransferase